MTAVISEDLLERAAEARARMPLRSMVARIAIAVFNGDKEITLVDAKVWANEKIVRGLQLYGTQWTKIFLDQPQDKADAIIHALCD
ncbi:MAG: hypothetical protein AB199_03155 [Parcubacteria bacterium C7867-004]|nr:MAG: hypothetical protein AB199_03155 [Parcubacteria bacterium C7867-004]